MQGESVRDYIEYFDSHGLYIGIIPDADGEVWLTELCGIPLMETTSSRAQAEQIGIEEAMRVFSIINNTNV